MSARTVRHLTMPPVRYERGVGCVQAPATLDADNEAAFRTQLTAAAAASETGNVVVDLADAKFIDSGCYGVMAGAYKRATQRGAHLVLVAAPARIRERLHMFGFDGVFDLADTLEDALARYGNAR